jgi:hypothetical protein
MLPQMTGHRTRSPIVIASRANEENDIKGELRHKVCVSKPDRRVVSDMWHTRERLVDEMCTSTAPLEEQFMRSQLFHCQWGHSSVRAVFADFQLAMRD